VEYLRARREVHHALVISDPQPVANVQNIWMSAGQAATIGIFLLLFGGFLYIGSAIVMPILAAAVVAVTLAPLIRAGKRHGISPWISAILVVVLCVGALALAVTAMAGPVSEWIGRAPRNRGHHQAKARRARPAACGAARVGKSDFYRR